MKRGRVVEEANIILTNPDMLHASVLPGHKLFSRILSNLSHVVIDEVRQNTWARKSVELYIQSMDYLVPRVRRAYRTIFVYLPVGGTRGKICNQK